MAPSATQSHFLNTSRDSDPTTSPGSPLPMFNNYSHEEILILRSNLNLPRHSLRLCPFILLLLTWENRLTLTWQHSSFQVVRESDKASKPSFLQAKQPQASQSFLIGLAL